MVGCVDGSSEGISHLKFSGESNSVTQEMVNACKETSLPTLLSNMNWKIHITLWRVWNILQMYNQRSIST